MEIEIIVRAEILAALKLFAAVKDCREQLKGINLEIGPAESRLVATDGQILGCYRVSSTQPAVVTPLTNLVIPNSMLKPIKDTGTVVITIVPPEAKVDVPGGAASASLSGRVTLTCAGMSITGETVNAKYPYWRRTIPTAVSGEPAQFDSAYIAILARAYALIHPKSKSKSEPKPATIGYNGKAGALIDLGDPDFTGVIMPRWVAPPQSPPAWVYDSLRADAVPPLDMVL